MQLYQLTLSGSDTVEFLHRQLTADINALELGKKQLTAWCNIQGRVISLLWVCKLVNAVELYIPAATYSKVMPRLKMFVLRDDVAFSEAAECFGVVDQKELVVSDTESKAWQDSAASLAIPHLETDTSGKFLPQMLNLDCMGGLSFEKGCYPGQEIVARTHFRGKLKQRMLRLKHSGAVGEDIYNAENSKAGSIILSTDEECLAVVRLEALDGGLFNQQQESITLLPLPYELPELASG